MPSDCMKEAAEGLVPSVQVVGSLIHFSVVTLGSVFSCPTLKGTLVESC